MVRFGFRLLPAALLATSLTLGGGARAQGGGNPFSKNASNIGPTDTRSEIAPALPSPDLPPGSDPAAFLRAARAALATGRTGEAQQALEMAETRMLDRSTPLFQTNDPSRNPIVQRTGAARRALGAGDRSGAMADIDAALAMIRQAH